MATQQDNKSLIENYANNNKSLDIKIAASKEILTKEKSSQHLMNFELSKLMSVINNIKHEISDMEREYKRLVDISQEIGPDLKRIRNYFGLVNPMQTDRKAEWMQNLNNQLNTLDFNAEVRSFDPEYQGNSTTQLRPANFA